MDNQQSAEIAAMEERERPSDGAGGRTAELTSELDAETVQTEITRRAALDMGLIEPDDRMDPTTWRQAFEGIRNNSGSSSTPGPGAKAPEHSEENEHAEETAEGEERIRGILDNYTERLSSFRAEHPDFNNVVGNIELNPEIGNAVQNALLEDDNGPALAYWIGTHPEVVAQLNQKSATAAVKMLGQIAAEQSSRDAYYQDVTAQHLKTAVPSNVEREYQNRAAVVGKSLTQEERDLAGTLSVLPHVTQTLLAMGSSGPAVAHYLLKHPEELGRLNSSHPMVAAGELTRIRSELANGSGGRPSWEPYAERRDLPAPITPTRRASSSSANRQLSDSMDTKTWTKHFRARMGYDK